MELDAFRCVAPCTHGDAACSTAPFVTSPSIGNLRGEAESSDCTATSSAPRLRTWTSQECSRSKLRVHSSTRPAEPVHSGTRDRVCFTTYHPDNGANRFDVSTDQVVYQKGVGISLIAVEQEL